MSKLKFFFVAAVLTLTSAVSIVLATTKWVKYSNPTSGVTTEIGADWSEAKIYACNSSQPRCRNAIYVSGPADNNGVIEIERAFLPSSGFKGVKKELAQTTQNITDASIGGLNGFRTHKVLTIMDMTRESYYIEGKGVYWEIEFRAPTNIWADVQPTFEHVRSSMHFNN